MSSDSIKYVTDSSFESDVLKSPHPVLVDTGLSGAALAR